MKENEMKENFDKDYEEIEELEIENKRLSNEELEERIKLERNLNTLSYFAAFIMIATIIFIIIKILIIFGIFNSVL